MGLFDRLFKKKEKENVITNANQIGAILKLDKDTQVCTKDGKLQIDYLEGNSRFDKFYDTTRLIIDPSYKIIDNKEVYNCLVSWYNESDAIMLGSDGNEYSSRTAYRDVLAQIDLRCLQTDAGYRKKVMTDLLEQKRVLEYLQMGLQDNPQRECGNYIGGVRILGNDTIQKFFDVRVGEEVHHSQEMQEKRQYIKMEEERRKRQELENRRREMQGIKAEINKLEKELGKTDEEDQR